MIFEIVLSIILLYLYLSIQSLNIHCTNIDKDNNILYNNITKYIKEVQRLFIEISSVRTQNNDNISKILKKLDVVFIDIRNLQNISNENSYHINIIKDDTVIYSNYSNRYQKNYSKI